MTPRSRRTATTALAVAVAVGAAGCAPAPAPLPDTGYPWHTGIVSTTFWVGEVFDPQAADGSQRISTYDSDWLGSYGGCDGVVEGDGCRTEKRTADNGYFPTRMTPLENPFYSTCPSTTSTTRRASPRAERSCRGQDSRSTPRRSTIPTRAS